MNENTVLVLTNSASGLYDFRKELLTALMEEGCHVAVSVPDSRYVGKLTDLGCEVFDARVDRRGMNPLRDISLFAAYRKLLKKVKPAAVLTYTIKPNLYGGFACRLAGVKYLANITGLGLALENEGRLQKLLLMMYRTALKRAACVFFQNAGNESFMTGHGLISDRTRICRVKGSGVNLSDYPAENYPSCDGEIRILTVVRIMKAKGLMEWLAAVEKIHRSFPEVRFQLLGSYEEDERACFEPVIEKLQQEGIITHYGYRDDIPEFYRNCHAVLHPTYSEGMSNVLLEAAATGRPVIASNIDGSRETFENGVSGLSFTSKSVDSMCDAVMNFLTLREEDKRRMGMAGRAFVEANFDRTHVVKAYVQEILRCCQS